MNELEQLEQAIAALEAQRGLLGDGVVETALAPLRERLSALRQQTLGEQRKLVTVLFADLADYTALAEKMDPEDVREVLNNYFNRWAAAIERYGGIVEKYIGDAVMAIYGLPTAQENDAENAIRTALEMLQILQGLNAELERARGLRLSVRVGINTGPVVAGAVGERKGQDFVVVGDTINLASRLQTLAPVDGILISNDTYRHVRGLFEVQALPQVQVKGKSDPVQVYRVAGARPRAFRSITRGVEGVKTRMIGREAELKRLQDAVYEVMEDRDRRFFTLMGEAGIGKSRLVFEFENWLELLPEKLYYLRGRAYPAVQLLPYSLARDLFTHAFGIQDSDPPQTVREKLEGGIARALGEGETSRMKAHIIGRLLGLKFGDSPFLKETGERAESFHERARTYLGDYFRALTAKLPLVVLLEDIHWADESSLDLLPWLNRSLAGHPLLLLATARPGLLERRPQWEEALVAHNYLDLRPLSRRESRQLVEEILQKVTALPEGLRELVVANAEGNPFYIEELIKMLIEDGVIVKSEDTWRVEGDRLQQVRVPPTLMGVLQARFDGLTQEEQRLLQRASVIGRVFWDRAVEYLGQGLAAPSGQVRTDPSPPEVLGKLRSREMIFQRPESSFEDTSEYSFKHALLRDMTYESLLKRQRRVYHAHAARWLEDVTHNSQRAEEYAALIAGHYEQAGEAERAALWYRRAGEEAAARFANAESIHSLTRALELLPAGDAAGRYAVLSQREKVYNLQGAREPQEADLQAMETLAERLNDDACRAEVAIRRAVKAFSTGDYAGSIAAAQGAIPLSDAAGRPDLEATGFLWWGRSLAWLGEAEEAVARLEAALEIARPRNLHFIEADSLWNLAIVASNRSENERALNFLQQSLALAKEIGDRAAESASLGQMGVVFQNQGRHTEATEKYEQALQVFRLIGFRFREAIILNNLGVIAFEAGEYSRSKRLYEQCLPISHEIGDQQGIAMCLANLGDLARDLGDYSSAQSLYRQTLALCQEIGDRMLEGFVHTSLGLALAQMGEYDPAIERCRQGLVIIREVGIPIYELQGLSRLGRALLGSGQLDEAGLTYTQALALMQTLELASREMEAEAGLALLARLQGDLPASLRHACAILSLLEAHDLTAADEPSWVLLTLYETLAASADPRAPEVLQQAYAFLQARAANIEEAPLRESYLHNVTANRQILQAWEEHRNQL